MVGTHSFDAVKMKRSRCPSLNSSDHGGQPPLAPRIMLVAGSALLVLVMARSAHAWGRLAHRASAQLAETRLTPRARALIREILEPGESLADASTWADEYNHEIRGSAAWHFV